MADVPHWSEDDALEQHAREVIGEYALEMVDRLKVAHACAPGAQASWGITVDGVRYEIGLRVAPKPEHG